MLQHVVAESADELQIEGQVELLELAGQVGVDLACGVVEDARDAHDARTDRHRQFGQHLLEVFERERDTHEPGVRCGEQQLPDAGLDGPVRDVDQSRGRCPHDELLAQSARDRHRRQLGQGRGRGVGMGHEEPPWSVARISAMPSDALRRAAVSLMSINRATSAYGRSARCR